MERSLNIVADPGLAIHAHEAAVGLQKTLGRVRTGTKRNRNGLASLPLVLREERPKLG